MEQVAVYRVPKKSKHRSSRVQRRGQVTIPAELRNKLDIQEGDVVTFREAEGGILISSQKADQKAELDRALDAMGDGLRAAGITLEELIESGRQIREEIAQEEYGHLFDQ